RGAAYDVRLRDQPEDGAGAGADHPAARVVAGDRGHSMRATRRQFVQGVGLVLAAPGLMVLGGCRTPWVQADPPAPVYRLGYLGSAGQLPSTLREGLRELGYVEGQNLLVESRNEEGRADRLANLAAELVALPVDVIVTTSSLQVSAALAATS